MIKIADRPIGPDHPPFVIAEMSGNHNQSLDRAMAIVEAAAASGAHAIKLQTYTPDTMTLPINNGDFLIDDENNLWYGKSLYELYQIARTPWEWHAPLFERAQALGLIPFSTPFDDTAVDFLEDLGTPCYKIASFENADLPLIRKVAATGKPVIISTGMATLAELDETVRTLRDGGCKDIVLLKCTSTYPASPENSNLRTIPHLRELFGCEVGLSDHTPGIGVAVAAVALGATVIEKHFTLSRAEGGVDSAFSLEPAEMKALLIETNYTWKALGRIQYGPTDAEKSSLQFRRSIYVIENLKAGEILTQGNIRLIRPGLGMEPKFFDLIIGKKVNRDLRLGTAMKWDYIE